MWKRCVGQALLAGGAIAVFATGEVSVAALAGLATLNLCLGIAQFVPSAGGRDWPLRAAQLAWVVSAALVLAMFDCWAYSALMPDVTGLELAVAPEVFALAVWLAGAGAPRRSLETIWKGLSLFWLIVGEVVWLGVGNFQDGKGLFFGALVVIVLTLVLSKRCFHFGPLMTHAVNTAAMLLIGFFVADVVVRVSVPPPAPNELTAAAARKFAANAGGLNVQNARRFYSYNEAHGNPAAFAAWWDFFSAGFTHAVHDGLMVPMPGRRPSHRLRPGRTDLLECPIFINSRGFRGREIQVPKGAVYRIVCLGESTTFGMTFRKEDRPWPELLEQMINERLKPSRPVEVVNAGVPALDLSDNLARLCPEILPLQPDMIVSYHGYNGFRMIDSFLPPSNGPPLPPYPRRASRLAADLEYRLRIRAFLDQYHHGPGGGMPSSPAPLQTRCADCYRDLIAFARTNHIHLALANFCMAIDENSSRKVIAFYNVFGSGMLGALSGANTIHSEIVRQLAVQNPGVCFIDTHPGLNTNLDRFIDIVHFTQDGRQRLAENIFAAIRPQLEQDLAKPPQ